MDFLFSEETEYTSTLPTSPTSEQPQETTNIPQSTNLAIVIGLSLFGGLVVLIFGIIFIAKVMARPKILPRDPFEDQRPETPGEEGESIPMEFLQGPKKAW